jgi:5-methylphenazine-1-carboxylate 1-monooxygenase
MDIAIVGGGIGGLTLALALHQRGIPCRVYESAPEVKELGVGITLLPHAMRELTELGLGEALASQGIENRESCFFNRFGQLIHAEPRGRAAGYPVPEVGIHRGPRPPHSLAGCDGAAWAHGTFSRITSASDSTRTNAV